MTSTHQRLPTTPSLRTWNVVVQRGVMIELGQVQEDSEELARCAALCKFGIVPGWVFRTNVTAGFGIVTEDFGPS